jgi:trigger factor
MTDEPTPADPGTTPAEPTTGPAAGEGPATATAEAAEAAGEGQEKEPEKLEQAVEIRDIGPCKKHVKVSIDRKSIDARLNDKFSEMVKDAVVPGFRKGKAPRKVIERQYAKSVTQEVRGQLLVASLEQLGEDHDLAPLSPPDINPSKIELPKEGPLVYEFDVEVRPEFDLPNYKGLKIRRPVKTFSDEDVAAEQRRILSEWGQLVPKDGPAEMDDRVIVDLTTRYGDQVIGSSREVTLRVQKQLAFKDGVAERFGEQVVGAKAGDTRVVEITLSDRAAAPQLRGQKVQATLEIKDVKQVRLPELTHEFLHNFGVHSEDQLRELVHAALQRRLEYLQRRSARQQIAEQIAATATWELPRDLLLRQARSAMARRVMEMREAGIPEEEIRGRQRLLQQDILRHTELALKEHFVLQKIAEAEKIEVDQDDVNAAIEAIADREGESPRRVRAQLEKDNQLEALAVELIEGKVVDLILEHAEYQDEPLDQPDQPAVATVEEQAVPGELHDPTAEAERTGDRGQGSAEAAQATEEQTQVTGNTGQQPQA